MEEMIEVCNFDTVDKVCDLISMLEDSQDFNIESLSQCIIRILESWGRLNPESVDRFLRDIKNVLKEKNIFNNLLENKEMYNIFKEHSMI